jgi:hypothetical protein
VCFDFDSWRLTGVRRGSTNNFSRDKYIHSSKTCACGNYRSIKKPTFGRSEVERERESEKKNPSRRAPPHIFFFFKLLVSPICFWFTCLFVVSYIRLCYHLRNRICLVLLSPTFLFARFVRSTIPRHRASTNHRCRVTCLKPIVQLLNLSIPLLSIMYLFCISWNLFDFELKPREIIISCFVFVSPFW